jgi:hypothetical protein
MAILGSTDSGFIKDLMEVLGLDHKTTKSFSLRAGVGEAVKIYSEHYVTADDKYTTVFKKWKLTKEELEVE